MMHRNAQDDHLATLPIVDKRPAVAAGLVRSVLDSSPMQAVRTLLNRSGLHVEEQPIVNKDLAGSLVRLMFPAVGGCIADGAVVSVVCLYDRQAGRTLYAHPMHAGPEVNPLVRHLDGPMAAPKSQADADGGRASKRIIEHKRALWDRFVDERPRIGQREADRRWRAGYYWALKRLYFCGGCRQCRWGSPFFDLPGPKSAGVATGSTTPNPAPPLSKRHATIINDIRSSDAWRVESAYAKRGGFTVMEHPRLVKEIQTDCIQIVFPTNVSAVQAGALVAVAFTHNLPSRSVILSHCLCAGPESEIQFLKGDVAFRLPQPQPAMAGEDARETYRFWRRSAWSQFWLNELERGLAVASEIWLNEFWDALEALFGGNDIGCTIEGSQSLTGRNGHAMPVTDLGKTVLPSQALENTGARCFVGHATNHQSVKLHAAGLSTLMVNLGRRCNQACQHCHVEAGPDRTEEMSRETVDLVLDALRRFSIETLDITGGAPEMNPHFRHLATEASRMGCRVVDRCNLTIFFEPGYENLPQFLVDHRIGVTASLPSDREDIADRQRGIGSFAKSIEALQRLNKLGYGLPKSELALNLVFNPAGIDLGPSQDMLERQYKRKLFDHYNIVFDHLFVMNNMPINRFEHFLKREEQWTQYMDRLVGAFNPDTVDGLMCRRTISVGYDGRLYDCDFNQMMDIPLGDGLPSHIRDLDPSLLRFRAISTAAHCFGCTAGAGSSCNGALASTP